MGKVIEKPQGEVSHFISAGTFAPSLEQENSFYSIPTSPATGVVLKVLNTGRKNIDTIAKKNKTINHNQKINVFKDEDNKEKRLIQVTSNTSNVSVEFTNIEKLSGTNKTAKKLFIFNLIKLNQQAYNNGNLHKNYIVFSLQELQDIGFYNTPQSARVGFNNGMDILTSLKITGEIKKGNKTIQTASEVLFTGASIKNGECTVYINERIDWGFIAAFYTILPKYSFQLNNKAFDLILYIFFLARQNIKLIKEKNCFNISLRAIQNHLQLPSELKNKDPQRTIKEPIEKSIEEIMQHSNCEEFNIKPIVDNNASITSYLNTGYIEITLKNKYAKKFIELSQKKTQQIESKKRRQKEITNKALAINMAKKIEKEK